MRYFRYDGPTIDISDLQRRYAILSAEKQKRLQQAHRLQKLGTCIFWLVFLAAFAGLMILIHLIMPKENGVFGAILYSLGHVAWAIIALILSAILGAVAATPLWTKVASHEKALRRRLLSQACQYLRSFYQFQEPFLVTKCYCSSDRRFDRHDICLFTVDGKLRLTANLHYGFFDPARDLGCYEFDPEELSLCNDEYKSRAALKLQAGETTFLLGQRAKSFIQKTDH